MRLRSRHPPYYQGITPQPNLEIAMLRDNIELYTDGACKGNPGNGGWGVLIKYPDKDYIQLYGGEWDTTNNRMELLAAIKGMESIADTLEEYSTTKDVTLTIYTDSKYLKDGISFWIRKWAKNNWRTASGQVKNKDLWKQILNLQSKFYRVDFYWVKGHSLSLENDQADSLANKGYQSLFTPPLLPPNQLAA